MPFLSQFRAPPNLLTLLRLFIIPFLVIAITDGHYRLAFGLFLLAGISDGLDGLLARWLQQHTRLGQYLDPIADKLMLSTLFVTLTHVGLIPRYVTVLVFSRDLGILLIATLLFATGTLRDFRPSLFGKLNTVVQIVALVAVLSERAFASAAHTAALVMVRDGLLRTIAVLAPMSAAEYAWIVIRRVNAPPGSTVSEPRSRCPRRSRSTARVLRRPCLRTRRSQRPLRSAGTRRTRRLPRGRRL